MIGRLNTPILTLVVISTIFASVCVGASYWEGNGRRNGLIINKYSENELQGEYHGQSGAIQFTSEVGDGYHLLSIAKSDGHPLIVTRKYRGSSALTMTMGNSKFFAKINEPESGLPKYTPYKIPMQFHDHVERAMKFGHISSTPNYDFFDNENVNAHLQEAVKELVSHAEAELIVEAAKALGNAGVKGFDSQAALQFYVLARRLAKIKDTLNGLAQSSYSQLQSFVHSQWITKQETCPECTTGSCPYYGDKDYGCNGMCGQSCNCWSFVCGDCCVHQGCLDHDLCCARDGYFSSSCLFVYGFSCSGYTC